MNKPNNKTYLVPQSSRTYMDITGGYSRFDNLFRDKALTAHTNKFINDRFLEVYDSIRNIPEGGTKLYKSIFSSYLIDELFLA